MIKNWKEIKYKVKVFGNLDEGSIINAIVIYKDGDKALIYHPKTRGECSSFEICIKKTGKDYWETTKHSDNTYINVVSNSKATEQMLFGKKFNWKRKFYNKGD